MYQRIDNKGIPNVNGTNQSSSGETTFSGASNNWVLSNYNTGFYVLSGNHSLKVKKEMQQTPNENQIWPANIGGNATDTYCTGYIDHGTAPTNEGYEYIVLPDSNVSEMQNLDTTIQSGNKPYTVHQKNATAHIVEHKAKNIFGYAFFNAASGLTYDKVSDADASCLVMTEYNDAAKELLMSVSNPDIGFASKTYTPSTQVTRQITLQGEWALVATVAGVQILSANATKTVVEFTLVDGLPKESLLNKIIATGCTYQTINFNDFESGWGIWNDGGSDSRRSSNDASYALGTYCVQLRDNNSSSVMTTSNLDLSNYEELTIDFSYYPRSMDNSSEDFWLQISTNGGSSYTTVEEWNRGDEFENDQRYYDQVIINGPFTSNTKLRFRCDASGNSDWVYIDEVSISGCGSGGSSSKSVKTKKETVLSVENPVADENKGSLELKLYPNPASDYITVKLTNAASAIETIRILDLNGRIIDRIAANKANTQTINISRLEPGVYFIATVVKGSQKAIIKKIIVEK